MQARPTVSIVGRMERDTVPDRSDPVPFSDQVGLVLRAYRRERGLSQRAFAEEVRVTQPTVARLERSAEMCSLGTISRLLAATGHTLGVVDADGALVTRWSATDLQARDRAGRRFPAHRDVRQVPPGGLSPLWWTLHEFLGTGACGPQPTWTAEGFRHPDGTRFGRRPRPCLPGEGPRFPFRSLEVPPRGLGSGWDWRAEGGVARGRQDDSADESD